MSKLNVVETNKFFLKGVLEDKGNGQKYMKYHLFENGITFILYYYFDEEIPNIGFDVKGSTDIKHLDMCPDWFKNLYIEAFEEFEKKDRIRRLANGKKLDVNDIVFHLSFLHKEGKRIYKEYLQDEKRIKVHDENLLTKITSMLKQERYEFDLTFEDSIYKILIKEN